MKTILFSIILLLGPICVSAQTYYYNNTKTFNENGYTYQCDVENGSGYVTLYNKSNQLTYVNMVNKTSGKYYFPLEDEPDTYIEESWVRPRRNSIINNAFTAIQKQWLKGYKLSTTLYISPATGKIVEICFNFTTNNPFATIPVSVYRNIEVQLKDQIWFTPTAEAAKYNYLFCHWRQEAE
ncbi:MAG: DUF5043 domain-containing protein [Dysgonomonas sp.]